MKSRLLFIMILVLTFGGIFISDGLGFWQTESTKQPALIETGEFAGMPDPEDIRGSYTLLDIQNSFGVEPEIIAKAFQMNVGDPAAAQVKDIEGLFTGMAEDVEIGTGSVRVFVAIYTGLPFTSPEYLPDTAVDVLKERGKWNESFDKAFTGYIVDTNQINTETDTVKEQEAQTQEDKTQEVQTQEEAAQTSITGKSTVKDAINLGLTLGEIEKILGVKVENENIPIKDLCSQNGLSFPTVKDELNARLQD